MMKLPMNKKKHFNYTGGFTLIELLVVVTILGILMSLAVNGAGAIRSQARAAQARNDCTGVSTAIRAFYTDYSRYPVSVSKSDNSPYEAQSESSGNSEVIKALMAVDTAINPRGVVYYESKMAKPSANDQWVGGIHDGGLFDPWGYTYGICVNVQSAPDFKYTGSVLKYYSSKPGDIADEIWQPITSGIGVFSLGKDQCSDKKSSSPAPGILSWY
jgi:general secretion pathway protein G